MQVDLSRRSPLRYRQISAPVTIHKHCSANIQHYLYTRLCTSCRTDIHSQPFQSLFGTYTWVKNLIVLVKYVFERRKIIWAITCIQQVIHTFIYNKHLFQQSYLQIHCTLLIMKPLYRQRFFNLNLCLLSGNARGSWC